VLFTLSPTYHHPVLPLVPLQGLNGGLQLLRG
jgi:hypothetical protein